MCGALFYDLPAPGTYYLTVGGTSKEEEGLFELSLFCQDTSDEVKWD
jgi:hypothetical protein